jgi:DNA-binding NarL/FixJ family response regulator
MFSCLIVDDNPTFLKAARTLLERQGVSVVGLATTIAEALRLVKEARPDVTLVDIELAGESGFDFARRLAETPARMTGVILMSTHAEDDFKDLIGVCPAAGFLSKSLLSATAIRDIVRAASSRKAAGC